MDTNTFNLYSAILALINTIVTFGGIIVLIITLRATAKSVRSSIEESSYNVWKEVYAKMVEFPESASFFNFEIPQGIDLKMLIMFLMILDVYAYRFSDNYKEISSKQTLLPKIMKSETSKKYWAVCKNHFYSNPKFVEEVDRLAQSQEH